jgi:hypothetical protein
LTPGIDKNDLHGLAEFLYWYRNLKPLTARLQAILRRSQCSVYPAAPRLFRKFCGIHYV